MTVTRTLTGSVSEPTLYVAFELGQKEWKLAMTAGFGVQPWVRAQYTDSDGTAWKELDIAALVQNEAFLEVSI